MKTEMDYYKSYICAGISDSQTRWQIISATIISGIVPWLICIFMPGDSQVSLWLSAAVYTVPFALAAYIYSFTGAPGIFHLIKANIVKLVSVYITYDISIVILLDRIDADMSIILCSVIIPAVVFASAIALDLIIIDSGKYKRSNSLGISISGCFALGYMAAQYVDDDYNVDFSDMFGYKLLSAVCFFIVVAVSIKLTDVLKLYYIRRIERCGYNIEELILSDINKDRRKRFRK